MEFNNVSTNIIRDEERNLKYFVTKNTVEIYNSIFNNKNTSAKSFTIIGNYGTGKSTFLWAAEKNLRKDTFFFNNKVNNPKGYEFIKLIGENKSISSVFKEFLEVDSLNHKTIIQGLEDKWQVVNKKGKDLVLILDEFGKFLEFINKTGNSEDLYLIQLIAEWANDSKKKITFIISLHQDFSEYGKNLSSLDKKEWEKVKGRFKEVLFNEPIEQLIFFASKYLSQIEIPHSNKNRFSKLNAFIKKTTLFPHIQDNFEETATALYPLDWLATNVLVNSLQRYGQNERSLFTFLNDVDSNGLNQSRIFSIESVFDYLTQNLSSLIHSYKNPHRSQWQIAFRALDRVELLFDNEKEYKISVGLIKTVCLLNIFAKPDSLLDEKTLSTYLSLVSENDENEILHVISVIEKAGIIRFYKHSKKINFLEGTDLDIEQELVNASKEINADFKIADEIFNLIRFPILSAKRYSFKKGSPRYFEFRLLTNFNDIKTPSGAIDGFINLIFDNIPEKDLIKVSKEQGANIFVLYSNIKKLHDEIFTILRLQRILKKRESDFVAKKLIIKELNFHKSELERLVLDDLFDKENQNVWIFNGSKINVESKRELNIIISELCDLLYPHEPILKNELINKEFISPQIATARKKLLRQLLFNSHERNLGFEDDKYPPEKAIYISMFEKTGIHKFNALKQSYELSQPQYGEDNIVEKSFSFLWEECENFLQSSVSSKRNLQELYNALYNPPFKLKRGFLDLWVLAFLIIKKEDLALFHEANGFIPYIDEDILDLILKNPKQFYIKSYRLDEYKLHLLEGYKELLQLTDEGKGVNSTFLKVYANFLRFYLSLNDYTKLTKKLSEEAINFRDSINDAKDPEEALFTIFPQVLGFNPIDFEKDDSNIEKYIHKIQEIIREIRVAYGNLLNRVEYQILDSLQCESTNFDDYKTELSKKLEAIKIELLSKENAVFLRRLLSPFDHRESWLKSVADVAINKPIDKLIDSEEAILLNNLANICLNLFDVADIHSLGKTLNGNKSLISISILNPTGENAQKKILIDELLSKELKSHKAKIVSEISKLDEKKRKQLLYELLLEELETK